VYKKGKAMQSVRKNFTMNEKIASDLEFLAAAFHKKQSQVIQELIERETERLKKKEKLKALNDLAGSFTGIFTEDNSIQAIKAEREV
jgi:hypothetical protein